MVTAGVCQQVVQWSTSWCKHQVAGGGPVPVHRMGPRLADLHCFLVPPDLPMGFRHGKFDPLPIDGIIGLGHEVHES